MRFRSPLLSAVLMLFTIAAYAQTTGAVTATPTAASGGGQAGMKCPMCGGDMHGDGMSAMIPGQRYLAQCGALGLSSDQINRIRNIQIDFYKQAVQDISGILTAHLDQQQALMADKVDTGRVEKQAREIGRLVGELDLAAVRAQIAARNVLTPDQRAKANTMAVPCMPMGGMMGQPSGGGGGGAAH